MIASALTLRLENSGDAADRRARLFRGLRAVSSRLADGVGRMSTERRWLFLFVALFLAFFIALLFQPGIGRGGR